MDITSFFIENHILPKNMKKRGKESFQEELERIEGIVLDIGYDGNKASAYVRIYDPITQKLIKWYDVTGHLPYLLSNLKISEIKSDHPEIVDHNGFLRMEIIKKYDLIREELIDMTKVIAKDPLSIGGGRKSIRSMIEEDSWEDNIKYHKCYAYDNKIVFGMPYEIVNNTFLPISPKIPELVRNQILSLFRDDAEDYLVTAEQFIEYFFSFIPDIKRIAFDIEVYSTKDRIPDAERANQKVTCISFKSTDGVERIFVLKREDVGIGEKIPDLNIELEIFDDEIKMLKETFQIFKQYPIILTFNGDSFDCKYLYNRAINLGFDKNEIPIVMSSSPNNEIARLKDNIHIDLYKFFHSRAIKTNAFKDSYKDVSLNTVSNTFLRTGKIGLDKEISELTLHELGYYCFRDSELTFNLTTFNDNLVMNIIILLMRITRMSIEDITRQGVSTWLRTLFYAEHRYRSFLIPRYDYIKKMKGKSSTVAMIKGKKFKGAMVVKPKPGIHFNVVVLDFASLYPSMIKNWNLSYETINCKHKECRESKVPETTHWVCKKRVGIMALVIGLLRDLRVKYFKPKAKEKGVSKEEKYLYKIIVQSLKIIINASYGVFGSENFPLFCLPVAEATTALGRYAIGRAVEKCGEIGVEVLYGDSVTEDMPILVRDMGKIDIIIMRDLFNIYSNNEEFLNGKIYSIPKKDIEVWSNGKWVNIKRIIKHNTNKKMYRVKIKDSYVKLTEDHSLFLEDGSAIKPIDLKVGDKILRSNLPGINEGTIHCNWAFALGLFLADGSCGVYKTSDKYGRKKDTWAINNKNKELLERCQKILPFKTKILNTINSSNVYKLVPINPEYRKRKLCECGRLAITRGLCKRCYNWERKNGNLNKYLKREVVNKKIVDKWRKWCYNSIGQKKIPGFIFSFDRESIISFLEGLFKGDGYSDEKYKYKWQNYNTNSHQLSLGIQLLIKNLTNQDVSYKTRNDKPNNITLQFNSINPLLKKQKPVNQIKEIVKINYNDDVFDIETENGMFNVGTIVAHNTDSTFLLNPSDVQIEQLIEWSKVEIGVELDIDKVYRYLALSDRKKNYLGVYEDGNVDIKGLTGKKSHVPPFIQKAFREMVDDLSKVEKIEDFEEAKQKILENVKRCYKKLEKKQYPIEELAFKMTLSKDLERYTKTKPQHVKAGRILKQKLHRDVRSGDVIRFVKSRNKDGVLPVELATAQNIHTKKYKEMIESTFEQVLDAIGINIKEISGKKIRKLDDFTE